MMEDTLWLKTPSDGRWTKTLYLKIFVFHIKQFFYIKAPVSADQNLPGTIQANRCPLSYETFINIQNPSRAKYVIWIIFKGSLVQACSEFWAWSSRVPAYFFRFFWTVVPRIECVIRRGTYISSLWYNTPCYPTLSVLCRGYLCYTPLGAVPWHNMFPCT